MRALVSRSGMERDFVPLVPRKREEEKPLKEEEEGWGPQFVNPPCRRVPPYPQG